MPDQDAGLRALRAIRQIIRKVSVQSRSIGAEVGLKVPALLCLRAIQDADAEEVTVAMVADAVSLSRSTTSVLIDGLVKQGLVIRERSRRDRRRVDLRLTEQGQVRLDAMPVPLQDRFVARLDALPSAHREGLLAALEEVVTLLDASELDAAPMLTPGHDV